MSGLADSTGTPYATAHPLAPIPPRPAPDPARLPPDPHEHRPQARVDLPAGDWQAVRMCNAHPAGGGNRQPGDVVVLRGEEARALIRQGYARPVLPI
jgi:hypothetical protein